MLYFRADLWEGFALISGSSWSWRRGGAELRHTLSTSRPTLSCCQATREHTVMKVRVIARLHVAHDTLLQTTH